MAVDALAKKYFFVVVGGSIASAAYFQGQGIAQVIAADVASDSPGPTPMRQVPRRGEVKPPRSVEPILRHNVFDSETGPLLGIESPGELLPVPGLAEGELPPCKDVQVRMIIEGPEPSYSFAALGPPREEPTLRRIGDQVGSLTLQEIHWDRVVLSGSGTDCQQVILSADNEKPAGRAPTKKKITPTKRKSKYALSDDLRDKITQVGPDQFEVDRSAIDQLLAEQAKLLGSAKLRPNKGGGMRVIRVSKGSLLGVFGVQRGDLVNSINGYDLSDPEKALEIYSRLQTASSLSISLSRKGKPKTIGINIK